MRFVLGSLMTFLVIKASFSIELPCDFNFTHRTGYQCRVVNFTNTNHTTYVTKVIGDHLYQTDTNYRNRTDESVVLVTMWNLMVHYLPGNLSEVFPHLKTLHIKKCGLKNLTRATEFHRLRKIYFGFNEIQHIPVNYFWHFCKLETLSLFGNRISEIPATAFRDLISLRRLSLNSNQLRRIRPELFDNCKNLEYVDLENNLLEKIDGRLFQNMVRLRRIYMRNNRIKSIANDFLSDVPNLQFALFQRNPCINESFPDTPIPGQHPLAHIQSVFRDNCSPPEPITTSTLPPTTTPARKKPPHERQRIYFYESCKWNAPINHRYW